MYSSSRSLSSRVLCLTVDGFVYALGYWTQQFSISLVLPSRAALSLSIQCATWVSAMLVKYHAFFPVVTLGMLVAESFYIQRRPSSLLLLACGGWCLFRRHTL